MRRVLTFVAMIVVLSGLNSTVCAAIMTTAGTAPNNAYTVSNTALADGII